MLGKRIYECMIERGVNPVELLRNLDIEFPDDIEETDIDHNEKTSSKIEEQDLKQLNLDTLKKITLYDGSNSETFYLDNTKILLKNGVQVGDYNYWVDAEMDIPKNLKNKENIVLDPTTKEILCEYVLYNNMNMYHELDTDIIYRQYKYDYGLDRFIKLSAVII
jgi:hypothetical protein